MGNTARGKYAKFISDRSGLQFPYREMVREWNGARVHTSEFEPKQPQLEPTPFTADPQGLQHPRPARQEPPTTDILPENPFSTNGTTTITVSQPFSGLVNNDQVRFTGIPRPIGGVPVAAFTLKTTLAVNLTATEVGSLTLTDATYYPNSGYLMIQKVIESGVLPAPNENITVGQFQNEVIQYTSKSGNVLSGLIRASKAPFRGVTLNSTIAGAHSSGAVVFGSYPITMIETTVKQAGQPPQVTVKNSYSFTVNSAATSTETGGGFQSIVSPLNDRA